MSSSCGSPSLLLPELFAVRGRRLYAIARLSIYESNRRMWAPWVVITVFLLVLAFTHWFLQPPRPAEMGRLYVGTLSLLCSVLLDGDGHDPDAALPADGHPAADDLHGRLQAGAAARADLGPDDRLHGAGDRAGRRLRRDQPGLPVADGRQRRSRRPRRLAVKAEKENRMTDFKLLHEQADQLRTRMPARVPIKGSLSFLDSRGTPHAMGIDVGQEQSMREPRSHIEGATPVDGHLELRHRARSVHAAGPAAAHAQPPHPGRRLSAARHDRSGSSTASTSSPRRSRRAKQAKEQPNLTAATDQPARRGDRAQSGGARPGPRPSTTA